MILVCSDSDGVLKDGKKPVPLEIIRAIDTARARLDIMFVRITGAPVAHLSDGLKADRAFGEAGGVELLPDGAVAVARYAERAVRALRTLKQGLDVRAEDGIVGSPYGTFGLEGVRHTSLTLFFGEHALYPGQSTTAEPEHVAAWIQNHIRRLDLPLYMRAGRSGTYTYLDIGHPQVMKKERVVRVILRSTSHERAYYLGDSGNDAGAMRLRGIIPVTFANGTADIQRIVKKRKGLKIEKPGPYGGVEEFFARLSTGGL
ncbi:MAG: hypothetical protein Q8R39_04510 [bacterium]|nr:hypothetical protein [bacterium]